MGNDSRWLVLSSPLPSQLALSWCCCDSSLTQPFTPHASQKQDATPDIHPDEMKLMPKETTSFCCGYVPLLVLHLLKIKWKYLIQSSVDILCRLQFEGVLVFWLPCIAGPLAKGSRPSKPVLPVGDHMFKLMSLQGTFHIPTQTGPSAVLSANYLC